MKLISMTDFVLEQLNVQQSTSEFKETIKNYANFLKQPLKLEMFIPCDEYGIPMEKPKISCATCEKCTCSSKYFQDYEKAQEKVLFKGFYVKMYDEPKDGILGVIKDDNFQFKGIWHEGEEGFRLNDICAKQRIEDLRSCNELTPNAIKQLGL